MKKHQINIRPELIKHRVRSVSILEQRDYFADKYESAKRERERYKSLIMNNGHYLYNSNMENKGLICILYNDHDDQGNES